MDIGKEKRTIQVEPVRPLVPVEPVERPRHEPVPREAPVEPVREREPARAT